MKTSESITKISPALVNAQKDFLSAKKSSDNPFFKSKYADLQSVISAIKESLNENGIAFIQSPTESEGDVLKLTTRLLHESGEWIEDTAVCPLVKRDPQAFGSALSYLRRYSLSAMCGIYQADDDGNEATKKTDVDVTDIVVAIKESTDIDSMKKIYISGVKFCNGNESALKLLLDAKDSKKKFLEAK